MASAASAAKGKATAAQNGEGPEGSKDDKQKPQKAGALQKKESALESLKEDHASAKSKLEEGLQFMPYIVLSTTLPA